VVLHVEKSYRNLELAKEMTNTARAALEQARESRRLDGDRYIVGVSLASEDWRAKAGKPLLQANLCAPIWNYLLAKGNDVADRRSSGIDRSGPSSPDSVVGSDVEQDVG